MQRTWGSRRFISGWRAGVSRQDTFTSSSTLPSAATSFPLISIFIVHFPFYVRPRFVNIYRPIGLEKEFGHFQTADVFFHLIFSSFGVFPFCFFLVRLALAQQTDTVHVVSPTIRYDTIRCAILTCARNPTSVSLIYRTETTTKKA